MGMSAEILAIRSKGENQLEIFMTQGESESPEDVPYLGRYVVEDIPYQKGGLTVIDIGYHYDESGTVQGTRKIEIITAS